MLSEDAEKYIVLLLGVKDDPVPSLWHLQKEMFILSRAVPKVDEFFGFEKHYNGPFSQALQELVNEPLYFGDAYLIHQGDSIILTGSGRRIFKEIVEQYKDNARFIHLLETVKLTREMYDRLEKEELLFLVYQTYPEYVDASNIYDRLVIDTAKRIKLADSLFAKGLITNERHSELKEIVQ